MLRVLLARGAIRQAFEGHVFSTWPGVELARIRVPRRRAAVTVVDARGEVVVQHEDAVEAQDVVEEVVGEDRQVVDVAELGDPGRTRVRRSSTHSGA